MTAIGIQGMTTMIEAIIYDKPAVMGLVFPFADVYMIIGE